MKKNSGIFFGILIFILGIIVGLVVDKTILLSNFRIPYLGVTPTPTSIPTPTCRPRPACLDATPRCLMPETSDMCPPSQKPTSNKYTCPPSGWVDCMPGTTAKPECSADAMAWYKANCPDFKGGAL